MEIRRPFSTLQSVIRTASGVHAAGISLTMVCLLVFASQSASAQIRLNLSGGQSGITVGPGGSGVIGQFNRAGGFQGISVGTPGNVRVLPNRSNGNVGVVVTGPPAITDRVIEPPRKPVCPPTAILPGRPGGPHVEVGPDHVRVEVNSDPAEELARIQSTMRAGQLDAASAAINQLVELYPEHLDVLHAYSLIHFAKGDFHDAAASHYDALTLQTEWRWNDVRIYFKSHSEYLQPLSKLQAAVRESPDASDVRFLLSSHYLMLGAVDHARTSLELTSRQMPDDAIVAALTNRLPPVVAVHH